MTKPKYSNVCYVSTIFRNIDILERFVLHIDSTIPDCAVIFIYCHDEESFNKSKCLQRQNIIYLHGSEKVFYTEAINIALKKALEVTNCKQFCVLDSDCFITEELHQVNIKNIGKAGIYRNIEIETGDTIPAGFIVKNKVFGIAKDVEKFLSSTSQNLIPIEYSNGRGLFFPADVIEQIGFWNENFPIYGSDNEFSYRLGKKIGLFYVTDVAVYSHSGETGENVLVKKLNGIQRFKSLWSIRSSSNLKTRVLFCWHAAPNKLCFVTWSIRSVATAVLINIFGNLLRPLTNFRK